MNRVEQFLTGLLKTVRRLVVTEGVSDLIQYGTSFKSGFKVRSALGRDFSLSPLCVQRNGVIIAS